MKIKLGILFLICIHLQSYAQDLYTDPITTGALAVYATQIKNEQQKTVSEQKALNRIQLFVGGAMESANQIQEKLFKGLKEVSGTLQNALQVQQIYKEVQACYNYSNKIKNLVAQHPEYSVLEAEAANKAIQQLVKTVTEVTNLLTSSETNLATAGDRYKILFEIQDEVQKLKLWLISITFSLERSIQIGFWKSINLMQSYVNRDKQVVNDIILKFNYLGM